MRYGAIATFSTLLLLLVSATAQIPEKMQERMRLAVTASSGSGGLDVGVPYAWWKMTGADTNTSGYLLDSAVSGLALTNNGCVLQTTNGYYYLFSGNPLHNMYSTNTTAFAPTSFTFCTWIFINSGAGSATMAATKEKVSGGAIFCYELIARYTSSKYMMMQLFSDDAGNNYIYQQSAANLGLLTNWYHMAWVWDGGFTTNSLKLYLNGVRSQGTSGSGGSFTGLNPHACPLWLSGDSLNYSLDGYEKSPQFFTNALSAQQIYNIYSLKLPTP